MAIKDALEVINQMRADGVIGKYAIGGAVGALLYMETASTEDVDIFVEFSSPATSSLVTLSPIYDYLTARGCMTKGESIVIGDWPVQFLPADSLLVREALNSAVEVEVEKVRTNVMTAEHLAAIAIQTGRTKDHARVLQFIEQNALDRAKLEDIVGRHGLSGKWQALRTRLM